MPCQLLTVLQRAVYKIYNLDLTISDTLQMNKAHFHFLKKTFNCLKLLHMCSLVRSTLFTTAGINALSA